MRMNLRRSKGWSDAFFCPKFAPSRCGLCCGSRLAVSPALKACSWLGLAHLIGRIKLNKDIKKSDLTKRSYNRRASLTANGDLVPKT